MTDVISSEKSISSSSFASRSRFLSSSPSSRFLASCSLVVFHSWLFSHIFSLDVVIFTYSFKSKNINISMFVAQFHDITLNLFGVDDMLAHEEIS